MFLIVISFPFINSLCIVMSADLNCFKDKISCYKLYFKSLNKANA
jgi:hypothetical protein